MKCKSYIYLLLLVVFVSCGNSVPKGVITPGKMEDVLYDFHLAQAMAYNHDAENVSDDDLMRSFYKKHGITEAEFDSSMVWYTRHIDVLKDIYESVDNHLNKESELLGINTGHHDMQNLDFAMAGDTVEIWPSDRIKYLCATPLRSSIQFSIDADTSYYQKDLFRLQFTSHFLKSPTADTQNSLTVGLVVRYENDSVSTTLRNVMSNQNIAMVLRADSAYNIRSISGFFCLNSSNSSSVLIDGLYLYKYHTQQATNQETLQPAKSMLGSDSSTNKKTMGDTLKGERLSPKQLRDQNPVEHRVRIRKR